ncbi:MAG: hypothetical protein BGO10_03050 [Chlamydia sp. 32-24]|nr:MAG: hypothetical protein BGO10_03050 [Chlamydia sp. 32-24]
MQPIITTQSIKSSKTDLARPLEESSEAIAQVDYFTLLQEDQLYGFLKRKNIISKSGVINPDFLKEFEVSPFNAKTIKQDHKKSFTIEGYRKEFPLTIEITPEEIFEYHYSIDPEAKIRFGGSSIFSYLEEKYLLLIFEEFLKVCNCSEDASIFFTQNLRDLIQLKGRDLDFAIKSNNPSLLTQRLNYLLTKHLNKSLIQEQELIHFLNKPSLVRKRGYKLSKNDPTIFEEWILQEGYLKKADPKENADNPVRKYCYIRTLSDRKKTPFILELFYLPNQALPLKHGLIASNSLYIMLEPLYRGSQIVKLQSDICHPMQALLDCCTGLITSSEPPSNALAVAKYFSEITFLRKNYQEGSCSDYLSCLFSYYKKDSYALENRLTISQYIVCLAYQQIKTHHGNELNQLIIWIFNCCVFLSEYNSSNMNLVSSIWNDLFILIDGKLDLIQDNSFGWINYIQILLRDPDCKFDDIQTILELVCFVAINQSLATNSYKVRLTQSDHPNSKIISPLFQIEVPVKSGEKAFGLNLFKKKDLFLNKLNSLKKEYLPYYFRLFQLMIEETTAYLPESSRPKSDYCNQITNEIINFIHSKNEYLVQIGLYLAIAQLTKVTESSLLKEVIQKKITNENKAYQIHLTKVIDTYLNHLVNAEISTLSDNILEILRSIFKNKGEINGLSSICFDLLKRNYREDQCYIYESYRVFFDFDSTFCENWIDFLIAKKSSFTSVFPLICQQFSFNKRFENKIIHFQEKYLEWIITNYNIADYILVIEETAVEEFIEINLKNIPEAKILDFSYFFISLCKGLNLKGEIIRSFFDTLSSYFSSIDIEVLNTLWQTIKNANIVNHLSNQFLELINSKLINYKDNPLQKYLGEVLQLSEKNQRVVNEQVLLNFINRFIKNVPFVNSFFYLLENEIKNSSNLNSIQFDLINLLSKRKELVHLYKKYTNKLWGFLRNCTNEMEIIRFFKNLICYNNQTILEKDKIFLKQHLVTLIDNQTPIFFNLLKEKWFVDAILSDKELYSIFELLPFNKSNYKHLKPFVDRAIENKCIKEFKPYFLVLIKESFANGELENLVFYLDKKIKLFEEPEIITLILTQFTSYPTIFTHSSLAQIFPYINKWVNKLVILDGIQDLLATFCKDLLTHLNKDNAKEVLYLIKNIKGKKIVDGVHLNYLYSYLLENELDLFTGKEIIDLLNESFDKRLFEKCIETNFFKSDESRLVLSMVLKHIDLFNSDEIFSGKMWKYLLNDYDKISSLPFLYYFLSKECSNLIIQTEDLLFKSFIVVANTLFKSSLDKKKYSSKLIKRFFQYQKRCLNKCQNNYLINDFRIKFCQMTIINQSDDTLLTTEKFIKYYLNVYPESIEKFPSLASEIAKCLQMYFEDISISNLQKEAYLAEILNTLMDHYFLLFKNKDTLLNLIDKNLSTFITILKSENSENAQNILLDLAKKLIVKNSKYISEETKKEIAAIYKFIEKSEIKSIQEQVKLDVKSKEISNFFKKHNLYHLLKELEIKKKPLQAPSQLGHVMVINEVKTFCHTTHLRIKVFTCSLMKTLALKYSIHRKPRLFFRITNLLEKEEYFDTRILVKFLNSQNLDPEFSPIEKGVIEFLIKNHRKKIEQLAKKHAADLKQLYTSKFTLSLFGFSILLIFMMIFAHVKIHSKENRSETETNTLVGSSLFLIAISYFLKYVNNKLSKP